MRHEKLTIKLLKQIISEEKQKLNFDRHVSKNDNAKLLQFLSESEKLYKEKLENIVKQKNKLSIKNKK